MSTASDYAARHHGGTSQADRRSAALNPDSTLVDERSIRDLLELTRRYATERLRFFDQDNGVGTWSEFLPPDLDLDQLVAWMEDPLGFGNDPAIQAARARPHLALFLTFLKLLQQSRAELNRFTRRHLEFYYRDLLRLDTRPAQPDQVHVLVDLSPDQDALLLPTGTTLLAGEDSAGNPLRYRTDDDLVVTRAQVAELRTLFTDKRTIRLSDVSDAGAVPTLLPVSGTSDLWNDVPAADRPFLAMSLLALGNPETGSLPREPSSPAAAADSTPSRDDYALLATRYRKWDQTISTILPPSGRDAAKAAQPGGHLYLWLWEFQELVRLIEQLDPNADHGAVEWDKVNGEQGLGISGKVSAPDDFETNLIRKLDMSRDEYRKQFERIAEVNDIFDLDRQYRSFQAVRNELGPVDRDTLERMETLITKTFGLDLPRFRNIMAIVESFYERWRLLVDLLRTAVRRQSDASAQEAFGTLRGYQPFAEKMVKLLLHLDFFTSSSDQAASAEEALSVFRDKIKGYRDVLDKIEKAFHMPADDWRYIRQVLQKEAPPPWEQAQVYGIFEQAHRSLLMIGEVDELKSARTESASPDQGFVEMIKTSLDHPPAAGSARSAADPRQPEQKPFLELDTREEVDRRYIRDRLRLDPTTCKSIQDVAQAHADATPARVWEGIYRQLVEAKWRRLGMREPRPEVEIWQNLYSATDATLVQRQGDSSDGPRRWPLFGAGSASRGTEPATIGLAIASPLLELAEGTRTITVTLQFEAEGQQGLPSQDALEFRLSTDKGMLPFVGVLHRHPEGREDQLQVTIRLLPRDPPIAPLPTEFRTISASPVLYLLLRDVEDERSDRLSKAYRAFADLKLQRVELTVSVGSPSVDPSDGSESTASGAAETSGAAHTTEPPEAPIGLAPSTLQNDEGNLEPAKPFLPFGLAATAGARLLIGHPELVAKPISRLSFSVEWMGIPAVGLSAHYANYNNPPSADSPSIDDKAFKVTASWLEQGVELQLGDVGLFNGLAKSRSLITVPEAVLAQHRATPRPRDKAAAATNRGDLMEWPRCLQWRLTEPDFQHLRYPALAAEKAMQLAARLAGLQPGITLDDEALKKLHVDPPYTPMIGRLRINYSASETIEPAAQTPAARLFHLEPFGCRPIQADSHTAPPIAADDALSEQTKSPQTYRFLPEFPNTGELFIGLTGVERPQNLALLFQLADGSADPDLDPAPIQWAYLDGNRWQPFAERQIIKDTTHGLLQTGIITFDLPGVEPSTLLPGDLYWIRGSVAADPRSLCDAVAVHTQSVSATRVTTEQTPAQLGLPLAPGTIVELEERSPAVQALRQPYSSVGGREAEDAQRFYMRVSERLRHRNRALTGWDYERMILERFPEIYKVKCLPVGSSDDPRDADLIQIIVIPDIRGKLPSDPFQPRAAADTLHRIEQFLKRRTSPLARFRIQNPRYVRLDVRAVIRFRDGYNAGFYRPRLNDELVRYLAPWAYDDGADIVFGNRIDRYQIVNFLEHRPYVDFVAHIDEALIGPDGQPWRETSAADVIYVSAAEHRLEEVNEEELDEALFRGIGYMAVGKDFIVGKDLVGAETG